MSTTNDTKNESNNTASVDNPMPQRLPEGENAVPLEVIGTTASDKLVLVMVGLPATGKTHIAKRICRFLSFFHDIPSQIFNVGDYRRELCGAKLSADFFDPDNKDGALARRNACDAALKDLIEYINQDGVRVAAFDATNSSKARRKHIFDIIKKAGIGAKRMFVESICDNEEILDENIRKVKLNTPDYRDMDPEKAIADFKRRRENYVKVYEPVTAEDGPHVKIINSKEFIVNGIRGYLPLKIVHFVMNLHTLPRTFYLSRHGQSEYNLLGKIGGDSGLTPAGIEYAKRLALFSKEYIAKYTKDEDGNKNSTATNTGTTTGDGAAAPPPIKYLRPCRLWTSTLRRTKETAQFIEHKKEIHLFDNGEEHDWIQFRPMAKRNLDELYAGTCDGMTYKEIEESYPDEFARRQADKLSYRYPRGESYMDVTLRLEPLAQEMERTREPTLIVAHQGILRIVYAYFMGLSREDAPYISIPLNNVIELTPHAYGCNETRFCLMAKEEMLNDGQDEPVTSMPRTPRKEKASASTTTTNIPGNDDVHKSINTSYFKNNSYERRITVEGTTAEIVPTDDVSADDPIMNAPGC